MSVTSPHQHDVNTLTSADIEARIEDAEQYCHMSGQRFTALRRNVYRLILEANEPLGAYDLLAQLQKQQQKKVGPPTIYRTLNFLLEIGVIHQLTSINAVVPCCHPRDAHNAVFLLCNTCQRVQECSGTPIQEAIVYMHDDMGFTMEQSVIELQGQCERCRTHTTSTENL